MKWALSSVYLELPLFTETPLYGTHSLRKRTLRTRILRKRTLWKRTLRTTHFTDTQVTDNASYGNASYGNAQKRSIDQNHGATFISDDLVFKAFTLMHLFLYTWLCNMPSSYRHYSEKVTVYSVAIWWPNSELMKVAPSIGQICN